MASRRKSRRRRDADPVAAAAVSLRRSKRRQKKTKKKSKKKKSKKSSSGRKGVAPRAGRGHRAATSVAKGRRRRKKAKTGARVPRGIPVEGLAGPGLGGRYPAPAKSIETFVTQSWRPFGNQDLNKSDVIHFKMKVREGQIIR